MNIFDVEQQISFLESKGLKFNLMNKEEAMQYLVNSSNLHRIASYRLNYKKDENNLYKDLDFIYLKELSIIDMMLRDALIHMVLDVEHNAKLKLLNFLENQNVDEYEIVKEYCNSLDEIQSNILYDELYRQRSNPYCKGIIVKHDPDYPVWAFIEIVTMGTFIRLYKFCADKFNNRDLENDFYLLMDIKQLRNALAHNNNLLFNMGDRSSNKRVNNGINQKFNRISSRTRRRQFKNEPIRQIITVVYAHDKLVKSEKLKVSRFKEVENVIDRIKAKYDFFIRNDAIRSGFKFFIQCIDIIRKN